MKKSEKPIFVDNLTQELKSASSIVLLDYTGLTVKNQQELKKRLKTIGAKMFITKNSLFKLAGKSAKLPEGVLSDTVLTGPTVYVISEDKDSISLIQVIYKFAKEFEVPNFKVAVIEGKFESKDILDKLAQLPSKEVLLAQAVGAIANPIYGLVGVLEANLQKLIYVLREAANKQ